MRTWAVFLVAAAAGIATLASAASYPPLVLKNGQTQQAQSGDKVLLPNVTGSTQCLHVDSTGAITGIGSDCDTATGTVTSVGMTGDGVVYNSSVSGSPVTSSGTLAPSLHTQTAKTSLMGPTSGSAAAPTFRQPADADLSLTDITTNDVSTSAHGFAPKAPNDVTKYLNGLGAYSVPPGTTAGANPTGCVTGSVANGSATTYLRSDGAPPLCSSANLPGSPTTTTQSALDNSTKVATTAYADALAAAFIAANHTFTAAQRAGVQTITISTATFTPNFDTGQNFTMTLSHSACPCTFANPSTTPVAGQSGVIEVIQSSSGSDTITTWGSDYTYAGGTSTIAFSTGASARDYVSYYVADSTHVVLSIGGLNATH